MEVGNWNTALENALENRDKFCITEILKQERKIHKKIRGGLSCMRRQLRNDKHLKPTIDQFTGLYERSTMQQIGAGILGILNLLPSYCLFVYDLYSDFYLTIDYYQKGTAISPIEVTNNSHSPVGCNGTGICSDFTREPKEFYHAFVINLTCLIIPIIGYIIMCSRELYSYIFEVS